MYYYNITMPNTYNNINFILKRNISNNFNNIFENLNDEDNYNKEDSNNIFELKELPKLKEIPALPKIPPLPPLPELYRVTEIKTYNKPLPPLPPSTPPPLPPLPPKLSIKPLQKLINKNITEFNTFPLLNNYIREDNKPQLPYLKDIIKYNNYKIYPELPYLKDIEGCRKFFKLYSNIPVKKNLLQLQNIPKLSKLPELPKLPKLPELPYLEDIKNIKNDKCVIDIEMGYNMEYDTDTECSLESSMESSIEEVIENKNNKYEVFYDEVYKMDIDTTDTEEYSDFDTDSEEIIEAEIVNEYNLNDCILITKQKMEKLLNDNKELQIKVNRLENIISSEHVSKSNFKINNLENIVENIITKKLSDLNLEVLYDNENIDDKIKKYIKSNNYKIKNILDGMSKKYDNKINELHSFKKVKNDIINEMNFKINKNTDINNKHKKLIEELDDCLDRYNFDLEECENNYYKLKQGVQRNTNNIISNTKNIETTYENIMDEIDTIEEDVFDNKNKCKVLCDKISGLFKCY